MIELAAHARLENSKIHLRWDHRLLDDVDLDAIDRTLLDKTVRRRIGDGVIAFARSDYSPILLIAYVG